MPIVPPKGAASCFWSSTACSLATCEADVEAAALARVDRHGVADAALQERLGALERLLVERRLRLGGFQVGALHGVVELHRTEPAFDLLVGLETGSA